MPEDGAGIPDVCLEGQMATSRAFIRSPRRRSRAACFGRNALAAEAHENIFTATAFLYGLALEELNSSDLEIGDPRFPVTIAGRAIKRPDR